LGLQKAMSKSIDGQNRNLDASRRFFLPYRKKNNIRRTLAGIMPVSADAVFEV